MDLIMTDYRPYFRAYSVKCEPEGTAVIETDPECNREVRIASFVEKSDAHVVCAHLNRGGGFDGWTPDFILR